ncbi:hypothetical protein D9615_005724 [Tricholomella constricta]|uniref:Tubulin/FtsZ 2-layer sandwich domain-containing protein n=1 Tax=Tricholomella constricta TaxID=117010 RepID=A0A8H5HA62_9AGAR|nr:hypothetical protein D9615_005724 [Tricholomella constricta]
MAPSRYLTAATIFRGKISSREAEVCLPPRPSFGALLIMMFPGRVAGVCPWIPDNVSVSLVSVPPVGQTQSATALSNSTAIQEVFKRTAESFSSMFKRKAFLHWYTGEGMDIMEFSEAESNTQDLIAEYQQYQEASADDDEEQEAFEDEEAEQ